MTRPRVLWLGVEPTPYLLSLQARACADLPFEVECAFERRGASQPWELPTAGHAILGSMSARVRLLWKVWRRRYSVLLMEGWGTPWLAVAGIASCLVGVPFVVSGDTWQAGGEGRLASIRCRVRRLLLRRAAATLPGGSRQRAFFLAEGARPDRLVVRQMTVDVEEISRRASGLAPERAALRGRFGLPREAVVAVSVCRLVPEKGVDLLLQALPEVPSLHLLVVGDGRRRNELQLLGTELGMRGRVIWAGRLPYDEVVKAYVASDFLVLPSRFEPWGLVVNEALASGLPVVVSSAVGCVDDLVAARGTGTIVPADDVAALAEALGTMAGDATLRLRAAERAREVIRHWTFAEEVTAIERALALAVRA